MLRCSALGVRRRVGAFRSVVAVVAMIGSSMKKARVSGLCDDLSLDVV